jgi:hypothetical protein
MLLCISGEAADFDSLTIQSLRCRRLAHSQQTTQRFLGKVLELYHNLLAEEQQPAKILLFRTPTIGNWREHRGRRNIDNFARAGVVQLLAGFFLDGLGISAE